MPTSASLPKPSWTSSLLLPKSRFAARPILGDRPRLLKQCTDDLYAWQKQAPSCHPIATSFVLHDGPPYANGSLHVGHALNKILKDITCRVQLLQGRKINYVPGWDCHGLPIELKVLQQKSAEKTSTLQPHAVRTIARELAQRAIEEQKAGFRGWAIMADWANAWKTMDKTFEVRQLKVFKQMLAKGLIYRRFKPVYWSPSSKTALAEAELEYRSDHESLTAFVKYPILSVPFGRDAALQNALTGASLAIWTTTPWTLPANRAIAVHPDLEYAIVEASSTGRIVVATSRVHDVEEKLGVSMRAYSTIKIRGSDLVGIKYVQFFDKTSPQAVLRADFVSADSGTGLVHIAPGHGMDDYKLGQSAGLDPVAPVDDAGRFTKTLATDRYGLTGQDVLKGGVTAVIAAMKKEDLILGTFALKHKYPYDWRSKQPVIIRATEQWFADTDKISQPAMQALSKIIFVPPSGRERLQSFVRHRSEWCISRQRAWGVPIPALFDVETKEALLTPESVAHIISVIEERGTDAWWTDPQMAPHWTPPNLRGRLYHRGMDTMDVWFDSGTSWSEMDGGSPEALADVVLEGTDQHRGWFQSSLLTKVASQDVLDTTKAPIAQCRRLITHGFTLDASGKKMSKSEGNVISPEEIMEGTLLSVTPKSQTTSESSSKGQKSKHSAAMGPDALRLWVAGCDYTKDVVVGVPVLKAVNSSLAKLRVTFRLILGLLDGHEDLSTMDFQNLNWIDQLALWNLQEVRVSVFKHYDNFDYHRATAVINQYVNVDLSAFYVESIKDRMYAESKMSKSRQHCQMVLWEIFQTLARVLSPITPLLVEEVCEHLPPTLRFHPIKSMWEQTGRSSITGPWDNDSLRRAVPTLLAINSTVKTLQELARADGKMGSSLQCRVVLRVHESQHPDALSNPISRHLEHLPNFLVVSQVDVRNQDVHRDSQWQYSSTINVEGGELTVIVLEPEHEKCDRCWKYDVPRDSFKTNSLCDRCLQVLDSSTTSTSEG